MIYYKTIFYNNIFDTRTFIIVSNNTTSRCIGEAQKSRGYISREDLLLFNDCSIQQEDVGENSYVVEYMTTALDGIEKVEILRLKVVV